MKTKILLIIVVLLGIFASCNKGPKVITTSIETESENKGSGIFDGETSSSNQQVIKGTLSDDIHTVVVKEILPASKYNYLKVKEGDEKFWIAIRKQEVEVGKTYFYKKALLKTRFESKEHNKVFDTIYLVSSLVQSNHGNNAGSAAKINSKIEAKSTEVANKSTVTSNTSKIITQEGSLKIADLVKDPKKYEGKTVQISGKCVKINPNIMDRNWIHIQDGTKDDFDLVITSDKFVPEGSVVTMKGTVTLNKDFGAGYYYDLILENGTVIN